MSFFSILLALIAEQYRPVTADHWIRRASAGWLDWVAKEFGAKKEGGASPVGARMACLVAFVLPTFIVFVLHVAFMLTYPVLAFFLNVIIVYLFFGFRQFSHSFTAVHIAIQNHDLPAARAALAAWYGPELDASELSEVEVISLALEKAIIGAHRHVLGVLFWFLVPIGPAGVVLYRFADTASQRWTQMGDFHLSQAARHFFYILDWIPSRITAVVFAIVGNFEGAMYAWRYLTQKWSDSLSAVILAAGSGALGVRLGEPLSEPDSDEALRMAEAGESVVYEVGLEPSERTMRSAIGLVWRTIVFWMALLAMLTIALWLG
ncbi:MAG: CobD/CbiB family protein [Polynucleobacter sp.]|nr:CobD/CbiB family protein [Polynucleobacter sp.]MDZ4058398.1 CobD/CbiB family protein [Polynucleobacter sp.]